MTNSDGLYRWDTCKGLWWCFSCVCHVIYAEEHDWSYFGYTGIKNLCWFGFVLSCLITTSFHLIHIYLCIICLSGTWSQCVHVRDSHQDLCVHTMIVLSLKCLLYRRNRVIGVRSLHSEKVSVLWKTSRFRRWCPGRWEWRWSIFWCQIHITTLILWKHTISLWCNFRRKRKNNLVSIFIKFWLYTIVFICVVFTSLSSGTNMLVNTQIRTT